MIGQTISRYRILAKLGEGTMGEVYKAEHIQLHHLVAIKILKTTLLHSEQVLVRFRREAEIAAGLDNPSLCNVIDYGEHDNRVYLVMRFCEGFDLKQMLANGPLPSIQAVLYAIQIAEGLEAAHRLGIVHRDLKPSNIVVGGSDSCEANADVNGSAATLPLPGRQSHGSTGDGFGQARIVDFGLALLPDMSRVTGTGGLVGTPAYMAPEQVRGEQVEHPADLWALGTIIYEMVSGRPAFQGDSTVAVLDAVRRADLPGLSSVCPAVPTKLSWIVAKALRKQPHHRYQDATEMLVDLRNLYDDLRRGSATSRPTWIVDNLRWLRWVGVGLGAIVTLMVGLWLLQSDAHNRDPLPTGRPSPVTSGEAGEGDPDLSPDGGRIAYAANPQGQFEIFVVAATGGRPLRVTDNDANDRSPVWFPGGEDLAFTSDRLGKTGIWKIGQYGGGATLLLENACDPAISPDGSTLAFAHCKAGEDGRIGVVSLGDPTTLRMLTRGPDHGLWGHREPAWSHDGSRLCYSAKNNLWLVDMATGNIQQLTHDGRDDRTPAWSPNDTHVYFESLRGNIWALWRVRVDDGQIVRMTMGGGAERHPSVSSSGQRMAFNAIFSYDQDLLIIDRSTGHENRLLGQHKDIFPSLSPDGSLLAFVSDRWGDRTEVWLQDLASGEPRGPARRLTEQVGHASQPALSPDSRWVAYYRFKGANRDLWVVSTVGGQPQRLTTHTASDCQPAWSPDGSHLAFASNREGVFGVWVMPIADGYRTGDPVLLTPPGLSALRPIWSPDGTRIAFCAEGEVWLMNTDGKTPPQQLTSGAQADRLRWETEANRIWISGLWGEGRYSLRTASPDDNLPLVFETQFYPDNSDQDIFFDVSGDGGVLVLTEQNPQSRIWLLEATEGAF